MPIQFVYTGERISEGELVASYRNPLLLEYLSQLRSVGFVEKTLRTKRTIVAAFLRWARSHQVPFTKLPTTDLGVDLLQQGLSRAPAVT